MPRHNQSFGVDVVKSVQCETQCITRIMIASVTYLLSERLFEHETESKKEIKRIAYFNHFAIISS